MKGKTCRCVHVLVIWERARQAVERVHVHVHVLEALDVQGHRLQGTTDMLHHQGLQGVPSFS